MTCVGALLYFFSEVNHIFLLCGCLINMWFVQGLFINLISVFYLKRDMQKRGLDLSVNTEDSRELAQMRSLGKDFVECTRAIQVQRKNQTKVILVLGVTEHVQLCGQNLNALKVSFYVTWLNRCFKIWQVLHMKKIPLP